MRKQEKAHKCFEFLFIFAETVVDVFGCAVPCCLCYLRMRACESGLEGCQISGLPLTKKK